MTLEKTDHLMKSNNEEARRTYHNPEENLCPVDEGLYAVNDKQNYQNKGSDYAKLNTRNSQVDEQDGRTTEDEVPIENRESEQASSETSMVDENQGWLPDNWTDEAQDAEHIDFTRIQQSDPEFKGRLYLPVSDDQGEKLKNIELEQSVKKWCRYLESAEAYQVENTEEMLGRIIYVCSKYINAINLADNVGKGIQTKYNIRVGRLMNAQKKLIKKAKGKWSDFFTENYSNKMSIRSAQVYMNLAKTPNIIRYAVFGQERLRKIVALMDKDYDSYEDPIAAFLGDHRFEFNPTEETNDDEISIQVDLVLARKNLRKKCIHNVPEDKLNDFVRLVRNITPSHLTQLRTMLDADLEINEAMDRLIVRRGIFPANERQPDVFKRKVEKFISNLEGAIENEAYLQEIDTTSVQRLKEKVEALETKLNSRAEG